MVNKVRLKYIKYMHLFLNMGTGESVCTVKKYFQDLLSQHIFFCQINSIIIYLVEIIYYFEFLMIK